MDGATEGQRQVEATHDMRFWKKPKPKQGIAWDCGACSCSLLSSLFPRVRLGLLSFGCLRPLPPHFCLLSWLHHFGPLCSLWLFLRPGPLCLIWAVHIVPRLPRKSSGAQGTPQRRQRDARAYTRPTPWQCTLSHTCSDPLAVHIVTPATQKQRSPRDTVHPTPWQCTLSHASTQKRSPRDTRGTPRDARAYIRPLGSAHCPTPATQKQRTEWVSEWVREGVSEWVGGWVGEWVGEWVSEWVKEEDGKEEARIQN